MRKWIAWLCAFCWLLMGAQGLAEEGWGGEAWEELIVALSSDQPLPVPKEKRIRLGRRDVYLASPEKKEDGWMDLLLLTTDAPNIDENFGRSEAMLICRVNRETGETWLLSLPEYALTALEGCPESVQLKYVNCFGGPLLVLDALNRALSLSVERYCAMNIETLADIVDAVGGVPVELKEDEAVALDLPAGSHLLSGRQAIDYVSIRRQWDGVQRYQELLKSLVLKASASKGMLNGALVLVDKAISQMDTNLTMDELLDLTFSLFAREEFPSIHAKRLHADGDSLLPDEEKREGYAFLYGQEASVQP